MEGRSIELVFGEGQGEQEWSGFGMSGGRSVHGALKFRVWPNQQVMRELLPEGGVGGKRTRSGRRREEGEAVAFITSSGSQGPQPNKGSATTLNHPHVDQWG